MTAQRKHCEQCGKEGEAGGPGVGWASLHECMPCRVQRRRTEQGVKTEYRAKPRAHGGVVQCNVCGCVEGAVDGAGETVQFKWRTRCWPCYSRLRPFSLRTEAEKAAARVRAKEYYWRVKKGRPAPAVENVENVEIAENGT